MDKARAERGNTVRVVDVTDEGRLEPQVVKNALSARSRIVALTYVSNVSGSAWLRILAKLWWTTSAWITERRLVAQICPRWNRLQHWFELARALKDAGEAKYVGSRQ